MPENSQLTATPMDDLELVTRYLNGHLDPEHAEQVRVRLETDPRFYNLAEPLLFAWSVPRHVERYPRPEGELEEMWDRFTKRASFMRATRRASCSGSRRGSVVSCQRRSRSSAPASNV